MNTTFKTFDPTDDATKYSIIKVGMVLELVEISTKRIVDYKLLSERIDDINPAWYDHAVELLRTPFADIIIPMPEFLCKHNSMHDRHDRERLEYLAIMN